MRRLMLEIREFYFQVRRGFPRQRSREAYYDRYRRLLAMEFAQASDPECFYAARMLAGENHEWVPDLYATLLARVGRGKLPLNDYVWRQVDPR